MLESLVDWDSIALLQNDKNVEGLLRHYIPRNDSLKKDYFISWRIFG